MLQLMRMLLLSLVSVFRRMLCCFGKRRRSSFSEPMTKIVVEHQTPLAAKSEFAERDWNCWEEGPRTVQEHIEQYRQRIAKAPTPPPAIDEPDYFKELTPAIEPQPKYYLSDGTTHNSIASDSFTRLQAKTDVPMTLNIELEDWQENVPGDWEELSSEETQRIIREKRREMRMQRLLKEKGSLQSFGQQHSPHLQITMPQRSDS